MESATSTGADAETPHVAAAGGAHAAKPGKSRGGRGRTWIGLSEPPPPEAGLPPAEQVEAGEIPRATLLAVLSAGPGRFLQTVRAEPHLVNGRFLGWRLMSLFDGQAGRGALQLGDTVMRVNGQSIERPEQFKTVWDSLATQSELVLLVERAGSQRRVRYRIVDDGRPQR